MENQLYTEPIQSVIKGAFQKSQELAAAKIQEHLEKQKNIPLNIAITGESGSGKSTFVNAVRGLDDDDEGAAPTGVVETTMEVTPYPHPKFPNVKLWDLPGIGTPNFRADEYLKKVGFEKFDFFIIVSADRFRENDVKLAKEIQRMGKNFYFVRSKIDIDVHNERRKRDFNEGRILGRIRENCTQSLRDQGLGSPPVFLVSSYDHHLYDFPLLAETLERELPELKRTALLFAMPNTSEEMIDRKKAAFQAKIKFQAALSAAVAAVPIPGLSAAVDSGLMFSVTTEYKTVFGLDTPTLERVARYSGVPLAELKKVIKSPLVTGTITPDFILKLLLASANMAALMAAEEGAHFIPLLGIPFAMGASFTFTYKALSHFLDMLAEDAKRVLQKAMG